MRLDTHYQSIVGEMHMWRQLLDRRGAFLITKSGSKVCDVLNISKFTLYNYLETIRKESGQK